MVAYSFRQRFVAPILAGTKRQTIRADRRRHARAGEEMQLYTGMRTKQCCLITLADCKQVAPIVLSFIGSGSVMVELPGEQGPLYSRMYPSRWHLMTDIDLFARCDGFNGWDDMRTFWRDECGDICEWRGVLLMWSPLNA